MPEDMPNLVFYLMIAVFFLSIAAFIFAVCYILWVLFKQRKRIIYLFQRFFSALYDLLKY